MYSSLYTLVNYATEKGWCDQGAMVAEGLTENPMVRTAYRTELRDVWHITLSNRSHVNGRVAVRSLRKPLNLS
jgi:hypothetical protein